MEMFNLILGAIGTLGTFCATYFAIKNRRKKLNIELIRYGRVNKLSSYVLFDVMLENPSTQDLYVTQFSIEDLHCNRTLNQATVNESKFALTSFPINISAFSGDHVYFCVEVPFDYEISGKALSAYTNRKKPFSTVIDESKQSDFLIKTTYNSDYRRDAADY